MNNRRKLVIALGAAALAAPFGTSAQQQGKVWRIGFLSPSAQASLRDEVFRQGLRDLGWIEGQNLSIEYRRAANSTERLAEMATELVNLRVDVLVASSTPAVAAAKKATSTIPIVSISADPVGNRFVASLSRPGGNITGVSMMAPALAGKRLELLKEINPRLSRVAFLAYAPDPSHKIFLKELEDAGGSLKVQVHAAIISNAEGLDSVFEALRKARAEALIIQPLFVNTLGLGPRILALAATLRLPTISDGDGFAESGGLIFFGAHPLAIYQRLAVYTDRVLKGANPADLPVEQPTRFELVINLKTAKTLGIKIPHSILVRTDRVIE